MPLTMASSRMDKMSIRLDLCYLPPVQYMAHWAHSGRVVLDTRSPYLKGTYRNRTQLVTAAGPLFLSVPLLSGKYLQAYDEVRIAYHEPWQKIHWRSIHDAYRKSPYFEHYADALEPYYRQPVDKLVDWNMGLMSMLLTWLQLEPWADDLEAEQDLRAMLGRKPERNIPDPHFKPRPYVQVFQDRLGFIPNASVLDLLFCTGPEAPFLLRDSLTYRE